MNNKYNTEILNNKILKSDNLKEFLHSYKEDMNMSSFSNGLYSYINVKGMKNTQFFTASGLTESYGYQLLNGKRQPSRDKVLQCALGLSLNVSEANLLLRIAEKSELYVRNKRDAILLYSLNNSLSLLETNLLLDEENEKIIE